LIRAEPVTFLALEESGPPMVERNRAHLSAHATPAHARSGVGLLVLVPLLLGSAFALLPSYPLRAQTVRPRPAPTPRPPSFPIGLDVVNVTVTVFDRSGALVSDLERGDFSISEDGRPQRIEVFGRALEPGQDETLSLDLGMLMDTSESMLKEIKLSQQAALRFLDAIPRARDLLTIFFDQDILVSRYDSEHQQGLIDRINSAKGKGNTSLYDAIIVYLSRVGESGARKVMVLFSDGEDTASTSSASEVLQLARSSGVTVYPILFSGSYSGQSRAILAKAFLRQLAESTGGEVFSPSGFRDLPAIFEKILDQLSAQYVIGFVSDDPRHDGKFRRLKVELKRKDLRLRYREGYYSPAEAKPEKGKPERAKPSKADR
jgi:Ca-activated chloride channel homolog